MEEKSTEQRVWKAEAVSNLVQRLASEAVERRFKITTQQMTAAGLRHVEALQTSERFVDSSRRLQEILVSVHNVCGQQTQTEAATATEAAGATEAVTATD